MRMRSSIRQVSANGIGGSSLRSTLTCRPSSRSNLSGIYTVYTSDSRQSPLTRITLLRFASLGIRPLPARGERWSKRLTCAELHPRQSLAAFAAPLADQRLAVELAALVFRQRSAQQDLFGCLECRQHGAAIAQQFLRIDAGARPRHHVAHHLFAI